VKLVFHSIFYAPELTGVARYTAALCEHLAAAGHRVSVVCPPPYFPQWKVQEPYRGWKYATERIRDVKVRRCPIWVPRQPAGIRRLLYGASFALSSIPCLLAESVSADWVFVIEPSFLNAIPALAIAALTGARTWLHVQDFEVDLAFSMRHLRQSRWRRFAFAMESWLMRRFDVVSSISGSMVHHLHVKSVDPARTWLFPNWVDLNEICPLEDTAGARRRFGISPDSIVALFSGSLGAKQAIDVLVDAAGVLRGEAKNVEVVICGEGPGLERARVMARNYANVRFLPLQPPEQLNGLLNAADIHVLTQDSRASKFVMPSKLLGMMASGRPVVATAEPDSEVGRIVAQCGIIVPHGNAAALARAIAHLAGEPEKRKALGERARAVCAASLSAGKILAAFEQELARRTACAAEPAIDPEDRGARS